MSVLLVIDGVTYPYPSESDEDWGVAATQWAQAVSTKLLQRSGGTFTLSAEVDFGASFGLKSLYYKSRGTNPSTTGILRLANLEGVGWRNAANNADLLLTVNASNELLFNGIPVLLTPGGILAVADGGTGLGSYTAGDLIYASATTTLAKLGIGSSNRVLITNGSVPSWALLVNANIDAAAAIAYSKLALTNSIVNADISSSAAIAYSKLSLSNSIVKGDLTNAVFYETQAINPSSPYSVAAGVQQIFWDASGGAKTVALPTAVGIAGRTITVTKTDTSFNAVTIDPDGTETIGGAATTTLNTVGESLTFTSDGSNWLILNRAIPGTVTAYTPTWANLGGGTMGASSHYYWREGQNLMIRFKSSKAGGAGSGASVVTFTIPTGLSIDTTLCPTDSSIGSILTYSIETSTAFQPGIAIRNSTNAVAFVNNGSASAYTGADFRSDCNISGVLSIPIDGWNG